MPERTPDNYKVCLVGAENSGKTSLLMQFLTKEFYEEDDPTIEDSHQQELLLENKRCILDILDTGGSSAYEHLHQKWFNWADAFIIVYNSTQKYTFELVPTYIQKIKNVRKDKDCIVVIAATHGDLEEKINVDPEEARELAYNHKYRFFETSAKSGLNVSHVFTNLVRDLRLKKREEQLLNSYESILLNGAGGKKKPKKMTEEDIENALSIAKDPQRREEIKNKVPSTRVAALRKKTELAQLKGPSSSETEHFYKDFFSAKAASTYPRKSKDSIERNGDPICDQYSFLCYNNRTIFALADGCNWGDEPKLAARKACDHFIDYLKMHQRDIVTVTDAVTLMLRAYFTAHNSIIEGRNEETLFQAGTTTMLGGMLFEVEPDASQKTRWMFVCLSLGDCKAYILKGDSGKIEEITRGNRRSLDARDPGGRLGPYLDKGAPDLRNLDSYYYPCETGDIIIVCSDGVHDNFDPHHLGKSPKEIGISAGHWSSLDEKDPEVEKNKDNFAIDFFNQLIIGEKKQPKDLTPSHITNTLIDHCVVLTKSSRDFMENNPTTPLPKDYKKYPGKMDHTTCLTFKVGFGSDSAMSLGKATAKTPSKIKEKAPAPVHSPENKLAKTPWKEYKTDEGEIYFYNEETKESRWEDPFAVTSGSEWKVYYDQNSDVYYYNEKTGESRWELPHNV